MKSMQIKEHSFWISPGIVLYVAATLSWMLIFATRNVAIVLALMISGACLSVASAIAFRWRRESGWLSFMAICSAIVWGLIIVSSGA